MEVVVRCPEVTLACAGQRLSSELAPVVPSADDDRVRPHSHAPHRLLQSESMEDSRRVGAYLDAGANLAQLGGLFEHLNVEASASKRQRGCQAADPCSDHYNSHRRSPPQPEFPFSILIGLAPTAGASQSHICQWLR